MPRNAEKSDLIVTECTIQRKDEHAFAITRPLEPKIAVLSADTTHSQPFVPEALLAFPRLKQKATRRWLPCGALAYGLSSDTSLAFR